MELKVTQASASERKPKPTDPKTLGFGRYFSDHMFMMEYDPKQGWHNARIEAHHPLQLDPACMVLHYGQEAFEGLKAYRGSQDRIFLFRYRDNLERLNRSCKRLVMPLIDVNFVSDALKQLVRLDREWIPKGEGSSLYIRPNIIATDPFLGVRPSDQYLFYIITGPVGAYYPEGFNPISIFVSDEYVRAVRGGIGGAKTAGNYAASLMAQMQAKQQGFSQVLWLDAIERKYIEEVGTMNIFFQVGDEIVTSPLTGSILPGVTRDSVIQLLKKWNLRVVERQLSIDEVVGAQKSGNLKEVFGTGTAAVISPVGSIRYRGKDYQVADGKTGALAKKLFGYLVSLQVGDETDPFGWVERIDG